MLFWLAWFSFCACLFIHSGWAGKFFDYQSISMATKGAHIWAVVGIGNNKHRCVGDSKKINRHTAQNACAFKPPMVDSSIQAHGLYSLACEIRQPVINCSTSSPTLEKHINSLPACIHQPSNLLRPGLFVSPFSNKQQSNRQHKHNIRLKQGIKNKTLTLEQNL